MMPPYRIPEPKPALILFLGACSGVAPLLSVLFAGTLPNMYWLCAAIGIGITLGVSLVISRQFWKRLAACIVLGILLAAGFDCYLYSGFSGTRFPSWVELGLVSLASLVTVIPFFICHEMAVRISAIGPFKLLTLAGFILVALPGLLLIQTGDVSWEELALWLTFGFFQWVGLQGALAVDRRMPREI